MAEMQTKGDGAREEFSALGSLHAEQALPRETILSLQSDDLNDQCKTCFENLRRCVKAAWAATQVQYTFTQTKLAPIQNRLDEHRLRLEIWMSDCGIADGNLSAITIDNEATLSNGLATLFRRIQDSLTSIYESIRDIERDALQSINDIQMQRSHVPAIDLIDEKILQECDHLTKTIYELAKLQHSIQMASAIHLGRGPEAALRLGIKSLQRKLQPREGDSESEEGSLSGTIEDNASHKLGDEKCSGCDLWFPWYTLSLHMDTCIAGTDTRHGFSRIEPEASTSAGVISAIGGTGSGSALRTMNNSLRNSTISSPPLTNSSLRGDSPDIEPSIRSHSHRPPASPPSLTLVGEPGYRRYDPSASDVSEPDVDSLPLQMLTWYQIFMICIGGTVGIGFAITSGEIIAIAGPGGTLIAFIVVGIVAICVMEGLCDMINLWPIPNAMVEFVRTFVDPDLAIVVGVTYWYVYCFTLAALIIGAGNLLQLFDIGRSVIIVIYLSCLTLIFLINCLSVSWFGQIQFWGGVLKILILLGIFILMLCINVGVNTDYKNGDIPFNDGLRNNPNVATTRGVALLIAIPLAVFCFIGVELVTVTACEAKSPKALRQPAKNIAYVILIIYGLTIGGISANIEWFDRNLPKFYSQDLVSINSTEIDSLGHVPLRNQTLALLGTSFAPVIATLEAGSSYVSITNVLVGSLVYSTLTCANVSLYVASRTLYGLTRGLDSVGIYQVQILLTRFSIVTHRTKIPLWSVIASSILVSSWLPILNLEVGQNDLFQIMSSVSGVGILLVWASQCLAFIRCNKWLWMHKAELVGQQYGKYQRRPYKSGGFSYLAALQPVPAYLGLVSCLVIVFVLSTASMWNGDYLLIKGLNIYLGPAIFILLFITLKIINRRGWVNLSHDRWDLFRALDELEFLGERSHTRPRAMELSSHAQSVMMSAQVVQTYTRDLT